ncbi:hypothetical protein KAW43_00030 [Candidatus Parcubacteria bacterium]|nr:hypothetical protein [Candidatus Parcubacteria bacterium]
MEKEITVGVVLGLVTREGNVRLRMRTERGSMFGENVSYRGDFELPGGGVEEKDLSKLLTPEALFAEGRREVKEELGIIVQGLPIGEPIYRTVYHFPDGKKEDWSFMIAIPSSYWLENAEMLKGAKTVDVDPRQLDVLGDIDLIVSGKKRMYRMAMAALYLFSPDTKAFSEFYLSKVKPDWKETELFYNTEEALADFRKELGVEDINISLSRGERL